MVTEEIKIVLIAKSIDGGTGTFISSLMEIKKKFAKEKATIKVIILEKPNYRSIRDINDITYLREKGFYPEDYYFSFHNVFNFLREIILLKKELNKVKPNVILSVDIHCNLLSYFEKLLFFRNTKLIFTTHINLKETIENKSSFFVAFILKNLVHIIYNKADILICVSKNLTEEIKRDFGIKKEVKTIYLGVSNKLYKTKKTDQKLILSAGRLVNQKDFYTLIDSFNLFIKEMPDYKLLIIGNGPLKRDLTKYSKNLGLDKKIKFMGWKQNLFPYFRKASIFVLSSRREGLPYVLLEAMSAGLPIISTNAPYGPSEIIENNKYGVLVTIGNSSELNNSMLKLVKDKKLYEYYSKKSLERSKFFSKEIMLTNYYNSIIKLV